MRSRAIFLVIAFLCLCVVAVGKSPKEANDVRIRRASHSPVLSKTGVPHLINYQAYLTDAWGIPITDTLEMTFRIYDTSAGGTELWSETHSSILITSGLFSVALGSINSLPSSIFADPSRWLQTEIEWQVLSPRRQIVSVVNAFRAGLADTAYYATTADVAAHASFADSSVSAAYAFYADSSTVAGYAHNALHADTAGYASYADSAGVVGPVVYADSAGVTGYAHDAAHSDISDYAAYADSALVIQDGSVTGKKIAVGTNVVGSKTHDYIFCATNEASTSAKELSSNSSEGHTDLRLSPKSSETNALKGSLPDVGTSSGAAAVKGNARNSNFVLGKKAGIWGESDTGFGVTGSSDDSYGVIGASLNNAGGKFETWSSTQYSLRAIGGIGFYCDTTLYECGVSLSDRYVNEGEANSITGSMVVDSAVDSSKLAQNAVTSWHIEDGTIRKADLSFAPPDGHSLDAADGSPTDVVYVDDAGKVGIGTTVPSSALEVVGDIELNSTAATRKLLSTGGGVNLETPSGEHIYFDAGGTFYFRDQDASDATRVVIESGTGNVGIGTTSPSTKLHVEGDATVTGSLTANGLSMGKIYLVSNGTIISTDGGTRVLYWDKTNGDIEITNTSGDWCDYWWQAQKGGTTSGNSGAIITGSSNVAIISGTNTNDYGFEVHFGQSDGIEGWCSVWLQYANGRLVGHYLTY